MGSGGRKCMLLTLYPTTFCLLWKPHNNPCKICENFMWNKNPSDLLQQTSAARIRDDSINLQFHSSWKNYNTAKILLLKILDEGYFYKLPLESPNDYSSKTNWKGHLFSIISFVVSGPNFHIDCPARSKGIWQRLCHELY